MFLALDSRARPTLAACPCNIDGLFPKLRNDDLFLRHASSDITMDIYTHAQDDAKWKALEKFEARLAQ
jgi:hypothetical protein